MSNGRRRLVEIIFLANLIDALPVKTCTQPASFMTAPPDYATLVAEAAMGGRSRVKLTRLPLGNAGGTVMIA
jgi:hypothetical protein